jgi:hypothetical protein
MAAVRSHDETCGWLYDVGKIENEVVAHTNHENRIYLFFVGIVVVALLLSFIRENTSTNNMVRKPLSPPALELHGCTAISPDTNATRNRFSFVVGAKEESLSTEDSFNAFPPMERKPSFVSERSSSTVTSTTTTTATKTTRSGTTSQGTSHSSSSESSDRIRSRYLLKLGVIGAQQGGSAIVSCSSSTSASLMSSTATFATSKGKETTNGRGHIDSECPYSVHEPTGRTNSSSSVNKMVRFKSQVQILAIPHHSQYSSQTKQQMWTSPEELEEMTYRNYFEFASEQWDWRQAVEEDDFCFFAGTWTHPAHVTRFSPSRQFCWIRSARQQQEQLQQLLLVQQQQQRYRGGWEQQAYPLNAWH